MQQIIQGKAYVVGDSIDTDQIIPAQYLVYSLSDPEERKAYGRFALSAVPVGGQGLPNGSIPFVAEESETSEYTVVIAGTNFGCGSSREHAPFALREAGVQTIIAESFARIFYRNCVDGGFLVPFDTSERLIDEICTGDELVVDTESALLTNLTTGKEYQLNPLGDVSAILEAGNVFEYARRAGFIGS